MSHNPFDFFGGISNFFNNVCTPEICTARHDHAMSIYDHEASNSPPRVDDERFLEMGSEEGIHRSFTSFSSASSNGRAIERSGFPRFCKYFFNRVDPSYSPTADDMNTLWDFFDREKAGRIDLFEFGLGIRQLLPHRGGKRALIMVDFQRDFVDGSLRVADGIEAVRQANRIRDRFDKQLIWLTRDWHPPDHMSFHDNHGVDAFSTKRLQLPNGEFTDQIMWPRHCVAGSEGAQWCPHLDVRDSDTTIDKGLDAKVDSYSGFFDNCKGYETKLQIDLRSRGVSEVYIVGLAYDFCVGYTALDAKTCGFVTYVVDDCTRSVSKQSHLEMDVRLAKSQVTHIHSSQIPLPITASATHMMLMVKKLLAGRKR